MRSLLDPLPRFLTVRGVAIVVAMVVLGIAISVHEYLESSRPHGRASSCSAPSVRIEPGVEADAGPGSARCDRPCAGSDARVTPQPDEVAPKPERRTPSLFEPDEPGER